MPKDGSGVVWVVQVQLKHYEETSKLGEEMLRTWSGYWGEETWKHTLRWRKLPQVYLKKQENKSLQQQRDSDRPLFQSTAKEIKPPPLLPPAAAAAAPSEVPQ